MRRFAPALAPLVRIFLGLFFSKKYLKGRHFQQSLGGYKWALSAAWTRNILRLGRTYPWPVHLTCYISTPENVFFHPDDINNFQARGAYFQCFEGSIYIGKGSYIAPNVGLITQNHDFTNLQRHQPSGDIVLGEKCWIGMNSVILPGVVLGPSTIVGAGSVVTRSFPKGHVVIAGSPAKEIRNIGTSEASKGTEN